MLTSSLRSHKFISPPPSKLPTPANDNSAPSDVTEARSKDTTDKFSKTLKAMATLALTLGPQAVQAAEAQAVATESIEAQQAVDTVTEQELITEEIQPEESSLVDRAKDGAESLKDKAEKLKDRLDPNGYFDEYETQVGDYNLRFRPMDIDLKPKWKSGPALRLKGDFLETSLDKEMELSDGWTMRQGVNARLRGEISTYDDAELDLEAGVFREYRGKLGEDYDAKFSGQVGIRQRFVGEQEGFRAGVNFRQEIEGGEHEFMGHDYALYAEGRQSVYYNFGSGETEMGYSFMVGPKKDFDVSLLGKKGTLTVTVGPEIKGSTNNEPFDLGVKSKVRLRF